MESVYTINSSDSEEDNNVEEANLPSREECEKRCQSFAEVTGTDSALAMFYLQDREWDLERSIGDYFADQDKEAPALPSKTQTEHRASFSNSSNKTREEKCKVNQGAQAAHSVSSTNSDCLTLGASVLQPDQDGVVRILPWNIDGLDPDNLQSRTEGACAVLLQEHPEVIFLQEVVHRSLVIIRARLEHLYTVLTGDLNMVNTPGAYFTAMLLKKSFVEIEKVRVMEFPGSLMERDLMEVQCHIRGVPMVLLTSHLESTKEYGEERQRQLKTAFDQMVASPHDRTVVFGGDLNLRDKEVSGRSAKPAGVYDLWECTGKRPEARFTWDLMINDNKQMGTKFQPRCRFDRLYIRHCSNYKNSSDIHNAKSKTKMKPISSYFLSPDRKKDTTGGHQSKDSQPSASIDNDYNNQQSRSLSGKTDNNAAGSTSPNCTSNSKNEQSSKTVEKSAGITLKPVYFELVGIQRLASCRRFPSDHWGILAHLHILGNCGAS